MQILWVLLKLLALCYNMCNMHRIENKKHTCRPSNLLCDKSIKVHWVKGTEYCVTWEVIVTSNLKTKKTEQKGRKLALNTSRYA